MNAMSVRQRLARVFRLTKYRLLSFPVAFLLLSILIPIASVDGQVFTANVTGYVTDAKGTPVEEAAVSILNTGNKQMWETVTDASGHYAFLQLMPGIYNLSIKAEGLNPYEVHSITLSASQDAEYSPKLAILDASKKSIVTASHVAFNTQTPNRSTTLSAEDMAELPTSLRNPLLLIHDTAGVTAITTSATPANTADQFSSRFGVNGGRQGGSSILVDGIAVNSLGRGDVNVTPGQEAVKELQIVNAGYDAQYGTSGGSAINLVTKNGTNTFHGSGFEFLRNDKMDANRWEDNKYGVDRQPFHRNQYGGDIAGPVGGKESRFFFFAGFEGLRQTEPSVEVATVPTDAMKRGDFSKATNAGGTLLAIYNPFSSKLQPGANYTRTVFPNNIIPANLINPAGTLVAHLYPAQNAAGTAGSNGQFVGTSNIVTDNNREDGRLDWAPTDHFTVFVRGTRARQTASVPTYFNNGTDQSTGQREPRVGFSGGAIWAPNAKSTYNVLLGASRWTDVQTTVNQGVINTLIGLPAATVALFQNSSMPQFSISDYQGLGNAESKQNASANYHGELNGSRQYLQHSLKFGFAYQIQRWDPTDTSSAMFNFTNGLTSGATASVDTSTSGNAIASLLLGTGASGSAPYNPGLKISQKSYALYVQDTWHVSRRLTVSAGLRYEVQGGPTETDSRFNNFDPLGTNPLSTSTGLTLKGGLVYGAKGLWTTNTNNVAPRLGVAYKLTDNVVFRTGYGISYVPTSLAGLAASDGYSTNTAWISTLGNAGFVPRYLLNNPFPNGVTAPVGSANGMSTGDGSSINANLKSHPTSYVGNFTADLEFQVGGNGVLDVGFASVQGRKLSQGVATNINQLDPTYLTKGPELNRLVTNPFAKSITSGPLAGSTIPAYQLLLPYTQFTSVMQSALTPQASSSFNALLLKYRYKLSRDMNVLFTYQWSKAIDNASESIGSEINDAVSNVYNLNGERSLSAHNVPKDLALNFVYALPFGREKGSGVVNQFTNSLIRGWQISSVARLASGLPLEFYAPNNLSTYGFAIQRPTITSLSQLTDITNKGPDHWFDTRYTTAPAAYTLGDMPRFVGNVRTGATANLDLSLSRSWNIVEKLRLQLRAEAYNVTNTPQYGRANTTLGSAGYGTITDTIGNPRNLQLGMRLDF
jgi:outer membrane receptor protein involved in Fe transport